MVECEPAVGPEKEECVVDRPALPLVRADGEPESRPKRPFADDP
jgi:hypothetical protein